MTDTEDVTDYLIRAENAATGLRLAGETISDNLVIAMPLKGLPASYNSFVVVHEKSESRKTLKEFKAALHNHANTEAIRATAHTDITALAAKEDYYNYKPQLRTRTQPNYQPVNKQCLSCGRTNHSTKECRTKSQLTCNFCHKKWTC